MQESNSPTADYQNEDCEVARLWYLSTWIQQRPQIHKSDKRPFELTNAARTATIYTLSVAKWNKANILRKTLLTRVVEALHNSAFQSNGHMACYSYYILTLGSKFRGVLFDVIEEIAPMKKVPLWSRITYHSLK